MTALRVTELRKKFGRVAALDGFSMALAPGEWVALLGPNGAGKTTLMRCIAGLCRPDGGRIEVDVAGDRRDALGIVPQELAIYERLTARENLEVFGRLHGLRGAALAERVDWALEWTLLADRAADVAGEFSGGMRRRLNIACGVLHRPRVVLLDEPTVGVDPQARSHIWAMLRQLRDSGATLLQSTHQIDEIESITDRAIVMDRGRDLAAGTHAQLVEMTFGAGSELRLWLDREPGRLELGNGFRLHGNRVDGPVADVARELPELLASVQAAGVRVESMRVETPGLEAVFTALTGRELRE